LKKSSEHLDKNKNEIETIKKNRKKHLMKTKCSNETKTIVKTETEIKTKNCKN